MPHPIKKALPLKIIAYLLVSLFFYILLPVYIIKISASHNKAFELFCFFSINLLIVIYLLKRKSRKKRQFEYHIQSLQEKSNILNDQNLHELKNKSSLEEKIKRYDSLKKIIEEINRNLVLESIADNLIAIAFSLAAGNKGTCVLYLVDSQTQLNLTLFKAKKEDKKLIIKAKEGDIFDLWVLRHTSPLLIEDIKKDFRFDLEKLKAQDKRPVSSLISSPLISENRFLGILRLDHPDPYFYSQDDLRFLVTICDLGAVAIENGELFKKTQDLATHDELTTLYTKGYFLERLKEEHKRSVRQNRPLSLLMLDIDYFKNYNDRFGHGAGDNVLKALSQDIVEGLKDYSPIISRFGGEEFCVILSGIDKKRAGIIADGLREKIEKTKIILRRQETNITVSIGVAGFPDDSKDESELIMKADKAMYEAKQKGRNRVCGN